MAGEGTELRCALKDAHTDRVAAPAAKVKGDTDVVNDNVIFYLDDIASGSLVGRCHGAKKAIFPKTAGLLINGMDRVFWNDANKVVTNTATDRAIGWGISRDDNAGIAGAAADDDVLIHFHQEVESSTY